MRHDRQTTSLKAALRVKSQQRRNMLAQVDLSRTSSRNDLAPKLELVNRPPGELVIPTRNVRNVASMQVQAVADSIKRLGFSNPVVIDAHNNVLDGVIRAKAALLLGLPQIPCVQAVHLDTTERRMLRLALNKLGENGSWNLEDLQVEIKELLLEDAPIEVTGFSAVEIDQLALGDDLSPVETGPLAPAPNAKRIARPGDIFCLGLHRLICGDATDANVLAALMRDEAAGLILTDEPYNVPIVGHVTRGPHREFAMATGEMTEQQFLSFNVAWMRCALQHLRDGGILGTFIDWRGLPTVNAAATQHRLKPLNLIVWSKSNAGMGSLYRSQHELLPLFKKGKSQHVNNVELGKNGRWRSNVWNYPGASSVGSDARKGLKDHPTVKPTAMLEDGLLDLTNRGDIVIDPFLGSGSTLIAAERTGRICCAVEIDPRYVDLALQRFEALTGQNAKLEQTGETLTALDARRKCENKRQAQSATASTHPIG